MKFNWGTGIAIAIVSFMSFILFLVITMSTDNNYSHDLVTEKYYQKELSFQDEIDAENNAKYIKKSIKIKRVKEGLEIRFPEYFLTQDIKGKVFLYRPSNKQLDFEIPILNSNTYLLVPEKRLVDGRWNIDISWKKNTKHYLIKKEILY